MKKLNLRIPRTSSGSVIMIMAFAVPVFAANSSDAAAAETTEAVESAGGLSATQLPKGTGCAPWPSALLPQAALSPWAL